MADSKTASRTDIALATLASGKLIKSAGPGAIPVEAVKGTDISAPDVDEEVSGVRTFRRTASTNPPTFGSNASVYHEQFTPGGGAVGNVMVMFYDSGWDGIEPYHRAVYFADNAGFYTSREIIQVQKRRSTGQISRVGEGSMTEISNDINGPSIGLESGLVANGADSYSVAVYDLDDLDAGRFPGEAPWDSGSGKKKFALSPKGQLVWGPDLYNAPFTRRYAILELKTDTTPPRMLLSGSTAVSPGSGWIDLEAPIRVPFHQQITGYNEDNSTANLLQLTSGAIQFGDFTASIYQRFKSSGFWQLVGPSGDPTIYALEVSKQVSVNDTALPAQFTVGSGHPGRPVIVTKGATSQAVDHYQARDDTGAVIWRVNKAGYPMIGRTVAPGDSDLNNSEMTLWLDAAPGATKLKIKAKDSAGTVRTGELALT